MGRGTVYWSQPNAMTKGRTKRMAYDFDAVHDRRGTDCEKWDAGPAFKGRDDLLPLWVADMDFALPDEVLADVRAVVNRGIFGYGFAGDAYYEAVQGWFAQRFGWDTERSWIVQTPGVVFAIGVALQAFTEPGDAVLVQQPVYYPFAQLVEANGRELVNSPLVYEHGRYRIDFDDFERQVRERHVKAFILCSPHNPVGRVWTPDELDRLGRICLEHDVLVIADEIHADFTYPGHEHRMFPLVNPAFEQRCVVCTAPSKTFNIAGLQVANIVIPNEELRARYQAVLGKLGYLGANVVALEACRAAYAHGGPWLAELKAYLAENLGYLRAFVDERLDGIELVEPEGTYLVWLDCAGLGLADEELEDLIVNEAHLWLDAGSMFGPGCGQFERVNIACPRATLAQALERLEAAVRARQARAAAADAEPQS